MTTNIDVKVVIIGAGIAGLSVARKLVEVEGFAVSEILLLEAQDYIGGRIKQNTTFLPGVKVDLGAELLHGKGHELHQIALENNVKLTDLFCWAHGDGGPDDKLVNGKQFGMYYSAFRESFIPFDSEEPPFVRLNEALWNLANMDESEAAAKMSLGDYLKSSGVDEPEMVSMAEAGFANTLCSTTEKLSLRQVIRWSRLWGDGEEEGDSRPESSFAFIIDHLLKGPHSTDLRERVQLNTVAASIQFNDNGTSVTVSTALSSSPSAFSGTINAERCVVTASAEVMKRRLIQFVPELPSKLQDVFSNMDFHNAVKVVASFRRRPWPENLDGMIMAGTPIPEIWFHDHVESREGNNGATCFATAFLTSEYAEKLWSERADMSQEDIPLQVLAKQLDAMFSHLRPEHLPDGHSLAIAGASNLPSAVEEYVNGFVWDWAKDGGVYISGGYATTRAGVDADKKNVRCERRRRKKENEIIMEYYKKKQKKFNNLFRIICSRTNSL